MYGRGLLLALTASVLSLAACRGASDGRSAQESRTASLNANLGNDFTGNHLWVHGIRSVAVDAKYPCLNEVAACLPLDAAGRSPAIADLCPSVDTPEGTWTFEYALYLDADCTQPLGNMLCVINDGATLSPGENHTRVECLTSNAVTDFQVCVYDPASGAGLGSCGAQTCGDGVIQASEVCDGADLGGQTCASLGYTGGTLGCAATCRALDTSGCIAGSCRVGYEQCWAADPEACVCVGCLDDGACTVEDDCVCSDCRYDEFCSSAQACNMDGACDPYNEGCGCVDCADHVACGGGGSPTCGDGVVQAPEVCDGANLGGQTCASMGAGEGTLACAASCASFDYSSCTGGGPTCNVGSCQDCGWSACAQDACAVELDACMSEPDCLGFNDCYGGCFDQACMSSCEAAHPVGAALFYQAISCIYCGANTCGADCAEEPFCGGPASPVCGDGVIDGPEVCDGANLGGQTCASMGFGDGTLACAASCASFDYSGCTGEGPTCSVGTCGTCGTSSCAMASCSAEVNACSADSQCLGFNGCYNVCGGDTVCLSACEAAYPVGAALWYQLVDCLYCGANTCLADCASVCPITPVSGPQP